jgi:hypothetical protein
MGQLLPDGTPLRSANVLCDEFAQWLRDGVSVVDDCLVLGKPDAVPRLDSVRAAVID